MSRRNWLTVLFWFLSLSVLFAQADSSFVYFKLKLVNAENGEAVPFATVLLNSTLDGITSDGDGLFDISLLKTDSLFISSIGYENLHIAVSGLKADSSLNIIPLSPRVYMLGEIMITQYPSYDRLVDIVINPILSTSEKNIFRAYANLESAGLSYVPRKSDGIIRGGVGGPITSIYNLFSRSVKNQKKYIQLKEDEKVDLRFKKKVSFEMITRITGLTDSITIVDFIKYCNFSGSYLNSASEYELFKRIQQNYEMFKRKD